ncbi:MAG: hypothetical protein H7A23_17960 [Leptospiraceae bacterium]|nr:hypothetical protein [Leptospiraceae bacterium]MCP5496435.1 hypothetical protein [Leptospiraceae bacterium]
MFLKNFNFLTDENIHPEVLQYLRNLGFNIKDVKESGLSGSTAKNCKLPFFFGCDHYRTSEEGRGVKAS